MPAADTDADPADAWSSGPRWRSGGLAQHYGVPVFGPEKEDEFWRKACLRKVVCLVWKSASR